MKNEKTGTQIHSGTPRRMDLEHVFRFSCGPRVSCYTQCCQDVTIALTPYDVMRMKNALEVPSGEFLENYTVMVSKEKQLIPLVVLKMNEGDKKCPFVTEQGCRIYEDRPWACRMFPLDMGEDGTFRLITDSSRCKGLNERQSQRISEWLVDQGIIPYDRMNNLFAEITNPLKAQQPDIDNPSISKMIFMAMYNLDRFREFVLESSFLDRFEVDHVRVEKIKRSDEELLKFGFDWIKFGVFGQLLFRVRPGRESA